MDKLFSLDELLQRITARPDGNIWMALIVAIDEIESTLEELQDTLEIFNECETGTLSGTEGALDLVQQINQNSEAYILLYDFENWDSQQWKTFDGFRSHLDQGKKGGFLILTQESTRLMLHNAPNFVSWLGARIYQFQKDSEMLTQTERDRRLNALQENFKMSDQDVIELAENLKLPADPEFGEWLILLDRGDLLERQK
ncbi:MAG: ABC transporter permease [Snowella sp.]|nr:ABC transporter permease [Snowella sp.]